MRRASTQHNGLPLCPRCFVTDYGGAGEHEPMMCALRVRAALDKALHTYQLWSDRWTALLEEGGAATMIDASPTRGAVDLDAWVDE